MFLHIDILLTTTVLSTTTVISTNKIQFPPPKKYLQVQWNITLTKCQGTREIGLLYWEFVQNLLKTSITNLQKNNQNFRYINMFLFNTVNNN